MGYKKGNSSIIKVDHGQEIDNLSSQLADIATQADNLEKATGVSLADFPLIAPEVGDTERLKRAIASIGSANANEGGFILLPKGQITVSSVIDLPRNIYIKGQGLLATSIKYTGTGSCIRYSQGSYITGGGLFDLRIIGNSNLDAVGVEISDTWGFNLRNVQIESFSNGVGLLLHNKAAWTEGTVLDGVRINGNKVGIQFRRTTGTNSFAYTRILNCSISVPTGGIGVEVGDALSNGQDISVYNGIFNINTWLVSNTTGIKFGANARISNGTGLFAGEGTGSNITTMVDSGENSGFSVWMGYFRWSDSLETAKTTFSNMRGRRFRDLGDTLANGRWFKVAKIQDAVSGALSQFVGRVTVQCNYGQSAYRTAIADFSFGPRGGVFKPIFVVHGDGATDDTVDYMKFRVYTDVDGYHYLYFFQPNYSRICTMEYTQDSCSELWEVVSDPSTDTAMTLKWDSRTADNYQVQQMYVGNGMVWHSNNHNDGSFVTSGDGVKTQVKINHGLPLVGRGTPEFYLAQPVSVDAVNTQIASITCDTSQITVNFKNPLPAGTNNITLMWQATKKGN